MLTTNLMRQMSTPHLLRAVYAEIDALTSTPLEDELLNRCGGLQERIDALAPIDDVLHETEMTVEEAVLLIRHFEGRVGSIRQTGNLLAELDDADVSPQELRDLLRPLTDYPISLTTVTNFIKALYYEMDSDLDAALSLLTALYDSGITATSQLSQTHLKKQPCTP